MQISGYQAEILLTALIVLEQETEAALHSAGFSDDAENNNAFFTAIQMAEENKILQKKLSEQYNLSVKK